MGEIFCANVEAWKKTQSKRRKDKRFMAVDSYKIKYSPGKISD
jgi:hypothetical protein